ncbi:hypothetical protein NMY22_g18799 [Coprinellus aureogranulatus]|nr:hypothetical protein NMY22_g18799 [Coprinellus aureogranulatus]
MVLRLSTDYRGHQFLVLRNPKGKPLAPAYANALINPNTSGVRIVPTRGQVVAVRLSPAPTPIKGGWGANEGFEYWFPRPLQRPDEESQLVILGGGREVALPRYEFYEADDGKLNEDVGNALKKFLPGVYPEAIEEVKVEWEWSGIMGYTPTGDPFVGRLKGEGEGQYIAAGFSGHGMPRAWGCAEAIASMVIADLRERDWVAPEWIPGHYFLS